MEHGRNDLDALIATLEHRGTFVFKKEGNSNDQLDWGIKANVEDIRDRVREYTVIDSAGFNVRPPGGNLRNDEPYTPFTAPLVPFTSISADNEVSTFLEYKPLLNIAVAVILGSMRFSGT